jgi:hypothetical protein
MPDTPSLPDDWTNIDAVEAWLRTKTHQHNVVIAARAALRVLPLVGMPREGVEFLFRKALFLPLCQAVTAPWFAAIGGKRNGEFRYRVVPGALAADPISASTVMNIVEAAVGTANAAVDGPITSTAHSCAYVASTDEVSAAAAAVDAVAVKDIGTKAVASLPLWRKDTPSRVTDMWPALKAHLHAASEGWEVWTEWYDARLRGDPVDVELETKRVIEPKRWNDGSAAVNAEIADIIAAHRSKRFETLQDAITKLESRLATLEETSQNLALRRHNNPPEPIDDLFEETRRAIDETKSLSPVSPDPYMVRQSSTRLRRILSAITGYIGEKLDIFIKAVVATSGAMYAPRLVEVAPAYLHPAIEAIAIVAEALRGVALSFGIPI